MEFENLMREKGTCCICGRSLVEDRNINLALLDKKAGWKHPTWGNVLVPRCKDRALAVVCDICQETKSGAEWIKYAIEIKGDEVILHDVKELENLEPVPRVVEIMKEDYGGQIHDW